MLPLRCRSLLLPVALALLVALAASQTVTLGHGGQLRGVRTTVDGVSVDRYLGIRYAKPPVGDLRFRKPQKADPWTGVYNATMPGNFCLQHAGPNTTIGDEDCLFLDVDVPVRGDDSDPKSVMVFIHGGGYVIGMGSIYIGAPLAAEGDVIVVTLNYRLGALGFLADENNGTGNYGLWDQKAAIVWVKENIASFGGNPESITIFGESAGAGSVVAQMMHQDNEGLFQRVISESGTLYQPWGWYLSRADRKSVADKLKVLQGCGGDMSVHDCYRTVDAGRLMTATAPFQEGTFHPVPDEDFFPTSTTDDSYVLSQRYDLMIGYNKNEVQGLGSLIFTQLFFLSGGTISDGVSLPAVHSYLRGACRTQFTDGAKEICARYLLGLYDLDTLDDKRRLINLFSYLKDSLFNTDITYLIQQHSLSNKATYAYQFSQFVRVPRNVSGVQLPDFIEQTTDHAEELFYVFGFDRFDDNLIESLGPGYQAVMSDPSIQAYFAIPPRYATEEDRSFSRTVQRIWTNFAKTGNPNDASSNGEFTWPQFDLATTKFLNLNANLTVIDAPELARHQQMIATLYPARRRLMASHVPPPASQTCEQTTPTSDKPCDGDPNGGSHGVSVSVGMLSTLVVSAVCLEKIFK